MSDVVAPQPLLLVTRWVGPLSPDSSARRVSAVPHGRARSQAGHEFCVSSAGAPQEGQRRAGHTGGFYTFGILHSRLLPPAVEIPNRLLFRQPEVCEIAQVQPYVLRSWEAEFPDLGVAKAQGGPRVYRRADVERVLKIKHLLFVEGLTLAGVRRKMLEEQAPAAVADDVSLEDLLSSDARERILSVRQSLRELSALLAQTPGNGEFELAAPVARRPASKPVKAAAAVASKSTSRRKVK